MKILLKYSISLCNKSSTIEWSNNVTLKNQWWFVNYELCFDIVAKLNRDDEKNKNFKNDILCEVKAFE